MLCGWKRTSATQVSRRARQAPTTVRFAPASARQALEAPTRGACLSTRDSDAARPVHPRPAPSPRATLHEHRQGPSRSLARLQAATTHPSPRSPRDSVPSPPASGCRPVMRGKPHVTYTASAPVALVAPVPPSPDAPPAYHGARIGSVPCRPHPVPPKRSSNDASDSRTTTAGSWRSAVRGGRFPAPCARTWIWSIRAADQNTVRTGSGDAQTPSTLDDVRASSNDSVRVARCKCACGREWPWPASIPTRIRGGTCLRS